VNIGYGPLEENSKLDDEKATQLFAAWYNNGAQYVYGEEPTTDMAKKAGKFIVQQMMLIILFLESRITPKT